MAKEKTVRGSVRGRTENEMAITMRLWEETWGYIKTIVDTVREPFLILDEKLRVLTANESFCRTFQVELQDTEKKLVYELGNGQWNIGALRKLLEDILRHHTYFKGFEVIHEFPVIGKRVMILNARRIHTGDAAAGLFPSIILLAMEDVTEIMFIADTLAAQAERRGATMAERTQKLEVQIKKLEQEIGEFKNRDAPSY